jgi:hypothetical protein
VSDLHSLTRRDRDDVLATMVAVEVADQPVDGSRLRALLDPALREVVRRALAAAGRTLIEVQPHAWLTGYDDEVADSLVEAGAGALSRTDRAVLALILLRTVAIPRARGRILGSDWTQAEPTTLDELAKSRHLSKTAIRASIRRLRTAGILRPGLRPDIVPGPQFLRLTAARSARIWEELLLVAKRDGLMADMIRRRRRIVQGAGS